MALIPSFAGDEPLCFTFGRDFLAGGALAAVVFAAAAKLRLFDPFPWVFFGIVLAKSSNGWSRRRIEQSKITKHRQDVAGNAKMDQGPGVLSNVTESASTANTHAQGRIDARLSS